MSALVTQHVAALRAAIGRLVRSPLNTLLSLAIMGIVLALPAGGWLTLDNVRQIATNASGTQQISIFLAPDAGKKEVAEIESRLRAEVPNAWTFVSREAALQRLKTNTGMAEIIASLPKNPLPDAFIVEPADIRPEALESFATRFASWPKVAHVQLDSDWIRRLDAFLRIARIVISLVGSLFAIALVAVTFNTIRLQIAAQSAEIEVARLFGATKAFIRRPYQYFGAIQGALGGGAAVLLVTLGGSQLAPPVNELIALYGSDIILHGLTARHIVALIGAGAILGWTGATLSVSIRLWRAN